MAQKSKALAVIEPISLPDRDRPAMIPSLPAWVASRIELLKEAWQNDPETGKHRTMMTLPEGSVLTSIEREAVERSASAFESVIKRTPENGAKFEAEMLVVVTKMLAVLPGQRSGANGYEAKGEAYLVALNDVPVWTVEEAIRKWYRGEHGDLVDDYRWAPGPTQLRDLARREEYKVRAHVRKLRNIANAVPLIVFSDEHCADMQQKLAKLHRDLARGMLPDRPESPDA